MIPETCPGSGLIIAPAVGYEWEDINVFVGSALQKTAADVLLILDVSQESLIKRIAAEPRLHVGKINHQGNPKRIVIKRFFIYRDIVKKLVASGIDKPIMLSDAQDVFFQCDPFAWPINNPSVSELILARESETIIECPFNKRWMSEFYSEAMVRQLGNQYILCAGTLIGSPHQLDELLIQWCDLMQDYINAKQEMPWGLDQAALNVLVHHQKLQIDSKIEDASNGRIITMHHETQCTLNSLGLLVNEAGQPYSIIHQYDRHDWLLNHLKKLLL